MKSLTNLSLSYRIFFFLLVVICAVFSSHPVTGGNPLTGEMQEKSNWSTPWVDSVFYSLNLDQRIAQLLMIRVQTDKDAAYYQQIENTVRTHQVGGIAFFRGGPVRQLRLTNRLQQAAKTPLLVAMDAEWGPSMRLDSTINFPRQMTLGAIHDEGLIYQMGIEVGRQLKRLGVHMNFAPVIDVNNNADNPVINFRAFGEDRYLVARKGIAYMKGMQDQGIIACGKHFPGHGDTNADSHYTLPVLGHSFHEIDSIHLYPFKELIRFGLQAVMVAHLNIPELDPRPGLASTLSENIVTRLLQKELGFEGLIITDALDMRGVSDHFRSGELELRALMAGNDILLLPEDVPAAISSIKKAITDKLLEEEYLNEKCKKILFYKEMVGLDKFELLPEDSLHDDLNPDAARSLHKHLAQASISLLKNEGGLLPLKETDERSVAALSIGAAPGNAMHAMMHRYTNISLYGIEKNHSPQQAKALLDQLKHVQTLIISVHNNSFFPARHYGINKESLELISALSKDKKVVLTLFANPYSLAFFEEVVDELDAIVMAYQDGPDFEEAAAQVIFGGMPARGSLPVSVGDLFPVHTRLVTSKGFRVGFGEPEDVGIQSDYLRKIDSIAQAGIDSGAYPGCQIVMIKDGTVFFDKAYGKHTYSNGKPVSRNDLYDLASLTKVFATTAAIMQLADNDLIDVDKTLGTYFPWLRGTDKDYIRIRELMAHQAKLEAWIPFYIQTLDNGNLSPLFYTHYRSDDYPTEVARNLYLHRNYRDSIYARIGLSPLKRDRNYLYSDLGFILLADIIEIQSGMPLDQFVSTRFYRPMGLSKLGFHPLRRFSAAQVIPTENDTLFRKQLLHGYVHDPAAAMLGGVSGHAGLFGNALDVAVMMHMILQGGTYGGVRYLNAETIREFTRVQFPGNKNRRGLGFDKPVLENQLNGPAAKAVSPNSFGHSGFTGTYAWADPAENLVFVFLSNRVYPSAENNTISRMNIRTNIHQVVYDAIEKSRALVPITIE